MINNVELRQALLQAGIPNAAIYLGDASYQSPKSDWLLGEFDEWFRSVLSVLDLGYSTDKWDCEDFSDLYASLARICHRKTQEAQAAGLPVGVVWFNRFAGSGHAVVFAHTSDQGLLFIEPQVRAKLLTLTREQLASVWLCKL